jgi:hypothetical protein
MEHCINPRVRALSWKEFEKRAKRKIHLKEQFNKPGQFVLKQAKFLEDGAPRMD